MTASSRVRTSRSPVLEMQAASCAPLDDRETVIVPNLAIHSGDLVVVHPGDERHEQVFADAVSGLISPRTGAVRFLGFDWAAATPDHANAMRGRIGHAFRRGEWISYLSLADNMLLGQLHHTDRDYAELREEAAHLSVLFGLPGLPVGLPADYSDRDRRRAAYVRAFVGQPDLIIVESSVRGQVRELFEPLLNAMWHCRDRGGAVLWFMLESHLWTDPGLLATQRLRVIGNAVVSADAAP